MERGRKGRKEKKADIMATEQALEELRNFVQHQQQQMQQQQQTIVQLQQQLQANLQAPQQFQPPPVDVASILEAQRLQMAEFTRQVLEDNNAKFKELLQESKPRLKIIDSQGVGKPSVLKDEKDFRAWSRNFVNYVNGVFPDAKKIVDWAVEEDDPVTQSDAKDLFPEAAGDLEAVFQ